jgi:thioredoxin 1
MKFSGSGTGKKATILIGLLVALGVSFYFKSYRSPKRDLGTSPSTRASTAKVHGNTAKIRVPRLVELGADRCIPCKMMAPILEQLRKEYSGKLQVAFIDVWKNPDAGRLYGIRRIPTQIFYDASGRELFRHVGFFPKEDILAKWKELGVDLEKGD